MSLTESLHLANAQRGMGAAKIAARMIAEHDWRDPANRDRARELLNQLGRRSLASLEASKGAAHG